MENDKKMKKNEKNEKKMKKKLEENCNFPFFIIFHQFQHDKKMIKKMIKK